MGEKTKLISLYEEFLDSAKKAINDVNSVNTSKNLTSKGKSEKKKEIFPQFTEAATLYRKEMIDIIDKAERKYTARLKESRRRELQSIRTITDVKTVKEFIESGLLNDFDIVVLAETAMENRNDLMVQAIRRALTDKKSNLVTVLDGYVTTDLVTVLDGYVTTDMKMAAFGQLRDDAKAKVNGNIIRMRPAVLSFNKTGIEQNFDESLVLQNAGTYFSNALASYAIDSAGNALTDKAVN